MFRTVPLSETCKVLFQNKFEKLVHLVGFSIRIYHDARSSECQNHVRNVREECACPSFRSYRIRSYLLHFSDILVMGV